MKTISQVSAPPVDVAQRPTQVRPAPRRTGALDLLAVLLTTGFAALVVLYHLGSRSIWIDEGYTISTANQHGAALLRAMVGDGGNMFAFYGWTHLVVSIFGNGVVALRLTPALSFVATIPFSYFLVRRLFGRRAAVAAAALVAASDPLVYWGQMARAYTPAVLLVTAATYFFVVAVQTDKKAAYLAYGLIGALAVNTMLLTGLCLLAHVVSLPLLQKGAVNRRRLMITYAAIAVCAVPIAVVGELRGTQPIQWIAAPTAGNVYYLAHFLTGVQGSGHHTATMGAALVAMLLALGASLVIAVLAIRRCHRSAESWAIGLLVAGAFVPILSVVAVTIFVHPLLIDRYVIFCVAAIAMLVGAMLARIRPAPLALVATVALVVLRGLQIGGYGAPIESWNVATSYLLERSQPSDCVAFFVEDGYTALDYYLLESGTPQARLPRLVMPATTWLARTPYSEQPAVLSPTQRAELDGCPRLWLVVTHGAWPLAQDHSAYAVLKFHRYEQLSAQLAAQYRQVVWQPFTAVTIGLYSGSKSST